MGDVIDLAERRKAKEPRLIDFGGNADFIRGLEVGQIWAHLRYYGQPGHSGLMAARMLGEPLICHKENLGVLIQIAEMKGLAMVAGSGGEGEEFITVVYTSKPQNTPPPKRHA